MLTVYADNVEHECATHTLSSVYLHGKLQLLADGDLLGYSDFDVPLEEGVHRVTVVLGVESVQALLFLWEVGEVRKKGLIVSPDDTEACGYASGCYFHRKPVL